jgi:hypothetical protein
MLGSVDDVATILKHKGKTRDREQNGHEPEDAEGLFPSHDEHRKPSGNTYRAGDCTVAYRLQRDTVKSENGCKKPGHP